MGSGCSSTIPANRTLTIGGVYAIVNLTSWIPEVKKHVPPQRLVNSMGQTVLQAPTIERYLRARKDDTNEEYPDAVESEVYASEIHYHFWRRQGQYTDVLSRRAMLAIGGASRKAWRTNAHRPRRALSRICIPHQPSRTVMTIKWHSATPCRAWKASRCRDLRTVN